MQTIQATDRSEQGFTLVELAIVLIIVGLLIGGILKGQELIGNARVNATVAQIKGIDAAMSTFRDKYNAIPGDMADATTRLPNCTGAPCSNGDGNGLIGTGANVGFDNGQFVVGSEEAIAFQHLGAADLITGIQAQNIAPRIGVTIPEAEVGGAVRVASVQVAGDIPGATLATGISSGFYVALTANVAGALSAAQASYSLTANQAARIDAKLDDARPNSGSVRGLGGTAGGANGCATTALATTGNYNEGAAGGAVCGLYARIQG